MQRSTKRGQWQQAMDGGSMMKMNGVAGVLALRPAALKEKRITAESTQQEQQRRNSHALIAQYIEPHPGNPGITEYRLRVEENGYPVWSNIGSLELGGENVDGIMLDYQISREAVEAVEAAWAYYARHKQAIDDRTRRQPRLVNGEDE